MSVFGSEWYKSTTGISATAPTALCCNACFDGVPAFFLMWQPNASVNERAMPHTGNTHGVEPTSAALEAGPSAILPRGVRNMPGCSFRRAREFDSAG